MIVKNINVNKLHDELVTNNIYPHPVLELSPSIGDFTFSEDVNMQLVQQIIDAHDPTPIPPAPTKEEILEAELARTNEMILELTELILGGM